MRQIICIFVLLLLVPTNNSKTVQKSLKRGVHQFGRMVECETGRSAIDYVDYGCHCGLGGGGAPVDQLDRCCLKHDKCYDNLLANNICSWSWSVYFITYKYKKCSTCAKSNQYSWWDTFGLASAECREALCECDAVAARCFKNAPYNDHFYNLDQDKCI